MIKRTIIGIGILIFIIACNKIKQNGNQIIFDGIKFTVISEGLISFETVNNDTVIYNKHSRFGQFDVEKK
tara:strand:+ start:5046 stop:5255 length:210 start_codon:yes stop_codon:yes gene_type:complete